MTPPIPTHRPKTVRTIDAGVAIPKRFAAEYQRLRQGAGAAWEDSGVGVTGECEEWS